MKKFCKVVCFALAAVMALSLAAVPALADGGDNQDRVLYMRNKTSDSNSTVSFSIDNYKAGSKISNVKSSNTKVAAPYSIYVSHDTSKTTYLSENREPYTSDYYYAYVEFKTQKAGKAAISYKVDGTTYKANITVKNYVNPVKSLKITGYSSKNLSSAFKNENTFNTKLTKNAKKGYVKVTANKGWRIRSIYWRDTANSQYYEFYSSNSNKPLSSASLPIPAMKAGQNYSVDISFENTTNKGTLSVYYYFRNY